MVLLCISCLTVSGLTALWKSGHGDKHFPALLWAQFWLLHLVQGERRRDPCAPLSPVLLGLQARGSEWVLFALCELLPRSLEILWTWLQAVKQAGETLASGCLSPEVNHCWYSPSLQLLGWNSLSVPEKQQLQPTESSFAMVVLWAYFPPQ